MFCDSGNKDTKQGLSTSVNLICTVTLILLDGDTTMLCTRRILNKHFMDSVNMKYYDLWDMKLGNMECVYQIAWRPIK